MTDDTYIDLQRDAKFIVEQASNQLQKLQRSAHIIKQKDEVDIATNADTASEELIIDFIHEKHPTHGYYSEEKGSKKGASKFTWVIDPLDGTKEYLMGLPDFGCLVAIEHKGQIIVGIAKIMPHELYVCSKGNGAFLNSVSIQVSSNTLDKAFVSFHIPIKRINTSQLHHDMKILEILIQNVYRVRATNFDAKALGYVARGIYVAHIIPPNLPQWYDVAPTLLLVEEAGGKVTDLSGKSIRNRNLSHGIVASNGLVHDDLLAIINN